MYTQYVFVEVSERIIFFETIIVGHETLFEL